MGIERFSRDWNYTITTIVYLKNEILLSSLPLMSRQLVHCKIDRTRADHSTMFDAKPNIPMDALEYKQALSRSDSWLGKAINPRTQDGK